MFILELCARGEEVSLGPSYIGYNSRFLHLLPHICLALASLIFLTGGGGGGREASTFLHQVVYRNQRRQRRTTTNSPPNLEYFPKYYITTMNLWLKLNALFDLQTHENTSKVTRSVDIGRGPKRSTTKLPAYFDRNHADTDNCIQNLIKTCSNVESGTTDSHFGIQKAEPHEIAPRSLLAVSQAQAPTTT